MVLPTSAIMYASGQSTDNSDDSSTSGSSTTDNSGSSTSTDNSGSSSTGGGSSTTTDNSGSSSTGGGSSTTTDNSGSSTSGGSSDNNNAIGSSGQSTNNDHIIGNARQQNNNSDNITLSNISTTSNGTGNDKHGVPMLEMPHQLVPLMKLQPPTQQHLIMQSRVAMSHHLLGLRRIMRHHLVGSRGMKNYRMILEVCCMMPITQATIMEKNLTTVMIIHARSCFHFSCGRVYQVTVNFQATVLWDSSPAITTK